ncbi:hypothetical protein NL676_009913 [Syzygium grande]|nr:hypothetical protein NL676_009913 [Syzygium grande]
MTRELGRGVDLIYRSDGGPTLGKGGGGEDRGTRPVLVVGPDGRPPTCGGGQSKPPPLDAVKRRGKRRVTAFGDLLRTGSGRTERVSLACVSLPVTPPFKKRTESSRYNAIFEILLGSIRNPFSSSIRITALFGVSGCAVLDPSHFHPKISP